LIERDQYVLGYRTEEQQRLQEQAEQLASESSWLFDQLGDLAGASVVEIGCGPHGCLELLAQRVGPSGSVVGVERSADAVAMARRLIDERGLRNVEVLELDARSTGLPRSSFDVATARLVLVNIPQPEEIVAEAVALVRPGGWVAFHEADYVSHVCDPPLKAWTSLVELLVTYSERNGIDPYIGRKLPRLLRDAGVSEIVVNPIIHVYPPGHGRRRILLDFADNLSDRILAQELASEAELAQMKAALGQHLANPDTLVVSHVFFQAWGRTPA
jgi:Methylase involved in ubiquinone/menaquinone biosynthesis